ncbi:unnamed protein product, partial [Tetraodon nigroviridis]
GGKDSPHTENTEPVSGPQDHPEVEDEAFFLKKEITAQHLLELLQKDIGMLTDSSSTVSSECVVSGNINPPVPAEPSSSQTCEQAAAPAEAPQEALCKVSLSQKRGTLVSEDPKVTTGPRSSRRDRGSQVLRRQLLKETEQPNRRPGEASGTDRVLAKGSGTGPFSAGVERSQNEQHLCSPGNQTDIDGSYLGFLPQSQSTPGIFNAPAKSSIQAKAEQLSAIQSRTENSSGSDAGLPSQERAASADVPSLPSVSYAQKVDAWRANQSGRTSLLDSLALQGSSGLSSTKTAHGAASDTQDHLPSGNDSNGSGTKFAKSIGTSSVVSLEVDNYAPYWTSRASTPPPQQQPRELNIEERIPVYLQNLGIDQSPSTILTPFVPRGPIREPEFSPTDLSSHVLSEENTLVALQEASFSSSAAPEVRENTEWMKLKVWGLCEPLELHEEDRRRVEEIKRELLRSYTSCSSSAKFKAVFVFQSQESTDAESATSSSSFPLRREPPPAWEAGTFPPGRDTVRLSASPLQDLSRPDLEAQIREIAAREGVALGVSWFIPAEELRAEGRKENVHQEEDGWRPSTAWFEAYGRIQPWREPLRQRQAPEDANTPGAARRHEADLGTRAASSAPAGVSLQEALARRRPDFLSQSRQRLRRLALQVEARKLQEVLSRRREERYGRPGGAARQLQPAGDTRRAVPRKEMIQRSKQIYDNLPEVRKRREEERRRAQYDSYRLKAQLYNKVGLSRATGTCWSLKPQTLFTSSRESPVHVLGRRTAWQ